MISMQNAVLPIAVFTFREAIRNRLFPLTIAGLVILLGLTEFAGELAITETKQLQSALIGAGMRLFVVCTVSLFVITSVIREFSDKGFALILSLPIPRYSYFFGKFLGFLVLAFVIAFATGMLLLLYSEPLAVLIWLVSLSCEMAIVVALSLLCLFTFSSVTVAFIVVLGFYLLARSMYAIQLVSASPILDSGTLSQQFMNVLLDALAFVLPGLHEFTRSDWLAYGAGWGELAPVVVQTAVYATLLCAAALFDLYRKDL
jgi:Cu-processing system permease protein